MRVVKEVTLGEIRVSIFSWNSKYIFKYELGPMESELAGFLEGEFLEEVQQRFKEMGESLLRRLG
jgi:hypothetical protein